jgi:hypothetical protein
MRLSVALIFFHILVYIAAASLKPTFKHIPKVCSYSLVSMGLDVSVKG